MVHDHGSVQACPNEDSLCSIAIGLITLALLHDRPTSVVANFKSKLGKRDANPGGGRPEGSIPLLEISEAGAGPRGPRPRVSTSRSQSSRDPALTDQCRARRPHSCPH
ncbi:hypothetical protein EVAR_86238_1 [Eumeta japonica]|uniref:Uncharacterized protein n=1 Tax=Eumeta variegata TaxID=151549 RepID=A0A4C1UBQ8_EUMVA|nr:hypothetical protein EVAR_86238_1 [Eumeta japonica]